ncbi:MAG: putative response regulator, CheY [Pedosphaera sp.]|nr:putative response regulator, CheY [Pedosphaera sp.]
MRESPDQLTVPPERMTKERYSVLLVDDSEDDRLFMGLAIQATSRLKVVGEVGDGEAAIDYLDGQNRFQDRDQHPFPDVVLLDLKMPRKNGHEVLQWLQTRPFGGLFVAVVSGSFLPEDIARSKALGADAYFKKGALKEELQAMINELTQMLDKA